MDEDQARARVRAERADVQSLLEDTASQGRQDRATEHDQQAAAGAGSHGGSVAAWAGAEKEATWPW